MCCICARSLAVRASCGKRTGGGFVVLYTALLVLEVRRTCCERRLDHKRSVNCTPRASPLASVAKSRRCESDTGCCECEFWPVLCHSDALCHSPSNLLQINQDLSVRKRIKTLGQSRINLLYERQEFARTPTYSRSNAFFSSDFSALKLNATTCPRKLSALMCGEREREFIMRASQFLRNATIEMCVFKKNWSVWVQSTQVKRICPWGSSCKNFSYDFLCALFPLHCFDSSHFNRANLFQRIAIIVCRKRIAARPRVSLAAALATVRRAGPIMHGIYVAFSDGVIHFPRIITRREWQQLKILAIQHASLFFEANLNATTLQTELP
jgi:hypothetical protein